MTRWRCESKNCRNFNNACLRLPHELTTHRPLMAGVLASWNAKILSGKGTVTIHAFPVDITLPLKAKQKKVTPTLAPLPVTPVTAPPPQQLFFGFPPQQYYQQNFLAGSLPPLGSVLPSPTPAFKQYQRHSSPIICKEDTNAADSLLAFFLWFKKKEMVGRGLSDEAIDDLVQKITHAHKVLVEQYEDLEGVRKMSKESWKEMGVPVGLGRRISNVVRQFVAEET